MFIKLIKKEKKSVSFISSMNLLIPSSPELHFLHAKRFKYHEHIGLMTKEVTEDFCRLVQFWNHHISARTREKFSTFLRKNTIEIQNCNRKRKHFSLTNWVEQFLKTKLVSSTLRIVFSDAFCPTVVDFFREFYKFTLNACTLEPRLAAITRANNHLGLAGLTNSEQEQAPKSFSHLAW